VSHATQIVDSALDAVSRLDMAAVADMFADDGVLELPNRADGPRVMAGRSEVGEFLAIPPQALKDMPIVDRRYYETTDPSVVVAEYRSEGTTRQGRPYRNRYIALFEFDTSGKIALWREYFDPQAVRDAFAPAPVAAEGPV
jgi:ketosteroid isomerase-like protein